MSNLSTLSTHAAAPPTGNRGVGIMFFSFFGTWWLCLGCRGLFGTNVIALLPGLLLGAALFTAGSRVAKRARTPLAGRAAGAEQTRRRRIFRNINLAQWAAIIALILILNVLQRAAWITPGIMLIVGAHFLPLAGLFGNRWHYLTGAALCALAVSYPWISAQGPGSPFGPLGAGLILLAGACVWLIKVSRHAPRNGGYP